MDKLSDLFRWRKKIYLKDGKRTVGTAWIRLVGDADYQQARNISLKRSKQLRNRLRDETTDDYVAAFTDIDSMSKDELILGVIFSEISDYRDEALVTTQDESLPELDGDNPSLEEQEEHQTKLEEIRRKRVEVLAAQIDKKSEERKEALNSITDIEELKRLYRDAVVNIKCIELFTTTFRNFCAYKGTFKDDRYKELAFDSFDEFEESASQLKSQLLAAYTNLEITGEDLKN